MKTRFGKIVVQMALVAYLAASSLGTGLHALVHEHHLHLVHEHHEHSSHVASDAAAGAIGTAIAASEEHADDADDACPVCQFHKLVQLPTAVDRAVQAAAVAEAPTALHEAPQLPHVILPYSPRGPPGLAANFA